MIVSVNRECESVSVCYNMSYLPQASISILGSSGGALNGFVILGAFFPTCNKIVSN